MTRPAAKPLGLYVHIPFCRQKCSYCDFYSLPHSEEKMDAYTAALVRHLEEVAPQAAAHVVDTVYIGGGTPTYLGAARLKTILTAIRKRYRLSHDAEITVEANPDSACDVKALRTLHRAGVNRVSLGVQSADDALLRRIGRIHTFDQVKQAAQAIRKAGIRNLSMDLIYGLPGQTLDQWLDTLAEVLALDPQHISCYGLKLEEGTPLYLRRKQETFPDDDQQAEMYLSAVDTLAQHGYEQYEISNFARPGFASRHNLKYWHMDEYAGFGPGAHSDFGDVRYGYLRDIDRYIAGELVLSERETISRRERDMEYIMLRLRLARGADPREFENAFRERFNPLAKLLHQYAAHGLACQNNDGSWRLTPKGFLVSNQIIGALQEELSREKADRLARAARGDYRVID